MLNSNIQIKMKLIDDTLKNPDKKWSRKSLTAFWCFVMANLTGLFIVVGDLYLPEGKEINPYAIVVFSSFLGAAVGTLGLTVWDKKSDNGK